LTHLGAPRARPDFGGDDPDSWIGWTDAGSARIRALDRDRSRVVEILWAAFHQGALTMDEADERVQTAYAARLREELGALIADLPGSLRAQSRPGPGLPRRRGRESWPSEGSGLLFHVTAVTVVSVVLVTTWALSPARFFWPVIPIAFMMLGVVFHGVQSRAGRATARGGMTS